MVDFISLSEAKKNIRKRSGEQKKAVTGQQAGKTRLQESSAVYKNTHKTDEQRNGMNTWINRINSNTKKLEPNKHDRLCQDKMDQEKNTHQE